VRGTAFRSRSMSVVGRPGCSLRRSHTTRTMPIRKLDKMRGIPSFDGRCSTRMKDLCTVQPRQATTVRITAFFVCRLADRQKDRQPDRQEGERADAQTNRRADERQEEEEEVMEGRRGSGVGDVCVCNENAYEEADGDMVAGHGWRACS